MSEEMILLHCSPTLAGIKTGNLFGIDFESREEMEREIRRLNKFLAVKGVRVVPLSQKGKRSLIYVYRPNLLKADLSNEEACELLRSAGYREGKAEHYILQLSKRLRENREFPHEIGLFLGYPPEDVKGFIYNRADGYKLSGTWKVYGDSQKALKTFNKYKKCTAVYLDQWKKGKSVERLTVVV